jgi:hypothetical protein
MPRGGRSRERSRRGHARFSLVTRTLLLLLLGGCLLGLVRPAPVWAQAADPVADARLQLGPVGLTPRFALRDIGIDTNVFNAAGDPERDFTGTVAPGLDAAMRLGRLRLTSETTANWTYFHRLTSQRALNVEQHARLDLDLLHVVPFVTGEYVRTRQRPNLEIDERVQQTRNGSGAGVLFRTGGRLELEAAVSRHQVDLGQTRFGNALLANALNRESSEGAITMRYEVTPLTRFVLRAATRYDRFDTSRVRDSDSISVEPGFEFSPSALFSGTATLGVRRFETRADVAPDFTGLIASVNLKYVLRDMTRFVVEVRRDVEYSFETDRPFFVSTMEALEVTQLVGYSWDVVGRVSFATLDYQHLLGPGLDLASRTDRRLGYGAGLGRRLGDDLRIGFDVDVVRRTSDLDARRFDGLRVGGSVTYGY